MTNLLGKISCWAKTLINQKMCHTCKTPYTSDTCNVQILSTIAAKPTVFSSKGKSVGFRTSGGSIGRRVLFVSGRKYTLKSVISMKFHCMVCGDCRYISIPEQNPE